MSVHTHTVSRPGLTLARVVRETLGPCSWNQARDLCKTGRVTVNGARALDPEQRLQLGAEVRIEPTARKLSAGTLAPEAMVYVDADVVVVNKPAGLLSVPFDPSDKDTLVDMTRAALRKTTKGRYQAELGVVHRIDIDTTGLLMFTRNLAAKRHLQQQFRAHSVHRRYLAIVHGRLSGERRFDTVLLRDRGDGLRGSHGHFRAPRGNPPADARRAITHVRALEPLRGATLVECALETGRQHQIRIHLSEAGHPLLGERVYIRDFAAEPIAAPRPMLHARELGFVHPRSEQAMRFQVDPPPDFQALLQRLRS